MTIAPISSPSVGPLHAKRLPAPPRGFAIVLTEGDPNKLSNKVIDLAKSGVKINGPPVPSKDEIAAGRAEVTAKAIRAEQSMVDKRLDMLASKAHLIERYKASGFSPRSYQGLVATMEQNRADIEAGRARIRAYQDVLATGRFD